MTNRDVCLKWTHDIVEKFHTHSDNKISYSSRNLSCYNDIFKSYDTIIAKFKLGTFFVSTKKYSVTTSKRTLMLIGCISSMTHRYEDIELLRIDDVNEIIDIDNFNFKLPDGTIYHYEIDHWVKIERCYLVKIGPKLRIFNDHNIIDPSTYKLYDKNGKLLFESTYIDEIDIFCEERGYFYEPEDII